MSDTHESTETMIDTCLDEREWYFPVTRTGVFLAHAGVAPISGSAATAIQAFADHASNQQQEGPSFAEQVADCRKNGATILDATPSEIALLGPTSLGLNLVAHGLDWAEGDQVVYYADDYPANVYCWMALAERGVQPVPIETDDLPGLGGITWDAVEAKLTDRTRLVALASANFISGYRIDIDTIGRNLHDRGILFCVDGIQTVGAFPVSVKHVDFLAADSHKWMLGPIGAGLFYVASEVRERLKPMLLGSWNVHSPNFIAQRDIEFEAGGRRFEPGTMNGPGIVGMNGSLDLLNRIGIHAIADRLLALRRFILDAVGPLGYRPYLDEATLPESAKHGIVSLVHDQDLQPVFQRLKDEGIPTSLRHDRAGRQVLRLSPHFYITESDLERAIDLMG